MLATTGEQGEPIVAPCSCLKNLSWKVKTQFLPRLILGVALPHLFQGQWCYIGKNNHICVWLQDPQYVHRTDGWLHLGFVGTGMLVKRAETSKETSSSSSLMLTDLRSSLKLLLSLTKDGVIPVYLWRILVRNLASWYVAVPQAETMGHIGQLALCILGKP